MAHRSTCEHCGRAVRIGEHYVCNGQVVLTIEQIRLFPELATNIRNRTK